MSKRLIIGSGAHPFSLPLALVTSTQAILARKRSGKSYTASVQAEEMLDAKQQIAVLDPTSAWWGLRSNAAGDGSGYPVVVFGGDHADAPLDFRSGRAMAKALVDHGFSAIFDIGDMETDEQVQFVMDFSAALLRINRTALHVFMDEADTFAPQQGSKLQVKCRGTVSRLVKQGGIKGIGFTMITQRSASLSWDVLSQVDLLTILRMSAPHDITPVHKWLQSETTLEFADQVKGELPRLPVGTAFVASAPLDIAKRVEVRQRRTFNSGATPKPGERKAEPKVLAKVDIEKLGQQISDSVRRTREESPEFLKRQIADLKAELAKGRPASPATFPVVQNTATSEKVRMLTAQVRRLEKTAGAYEKQMTNVLRLAASLSQTADQIRQAVEAAQGAATEAAAEPLALPAASTPAAAPVAAPVPRAVASKPRAEGDPALSGPEQKILDSLSWFAGIGVKEPEMVAVAFMAGYTVNGSFHNARAKLKNAGLCVYLGPRMAITPEGLALANPPNVGNTNEDLHAAVMARLGGPEKRLLEPLLKSYPDGITSAKLAEKAGYTENGSFFNARGRLKSLGLIRYESGNSIANDLLFPRGA